ncbi:hypothetical protein [Methylobacterium sp. Leaf106]|uniref:hypothetical protein n=1 Tax=Methylobacterium sp. Leaf106 TaxID=1736255 RepID=UPI0006FB1656|nr:hypothetical protein [Methylobacterium sp. Leaf106]KQP53069.1 hypothetical protein ASF34_01490 [Methylobacterium sp. Leaf106]
MSAVLASYVKMSTLVDGTMRVVLDIEPTAAPEAFAMLGAPGSPIALARITAAAAMAQDRKAQATADKKPLSLASKVALRCQERDFHTYLLETQRGFVLDAHTELDGEASQTDLNAEALRRVLGIQSRREIVDGSEAGRQWLNLEADYHHWQRRRAA